MIKDVSFEIENKDATKPFALHPHVYEEFMEFQFLCGSASEPAQIFGLDLKEAGDNTVNVDDMILTGGFIKR